MTDNESSFHPICLSDDPISDRTDDKLGYHTYVDTLKTQIEQACPGTCIGLFGGWGVGKKVGNQAVEGGTTQARYGGQHRLHCRIRRLEIRR